MRKAINVHPDVVRVLGATLVEGHALRLPAQLDRKLYTQVMDTLTRIGGTWSKREQRHVFPHDPTPLLEEILATGIAPAYNPFDFFETPPILADALVAYVNVNTLQFPLRVLEPSAGKGSILRALYRRYGDAPSYTAVELDRHHEPDLTASVPPHGHLLFEDFLAYEPHHRFHVIVMNPPFTSEADPLAYLAHLAHAVELLSPEGHLVAVAPAGFKFRQDRRVRTLRHDMELRHGAIHDLPVGSFKDGGTNVAAVVATAYGTARTPPRWNDDPAPAPVR